MEGETPSTLTDFLQDLDLWLMQDSAAFPTINRHCLDTAAANADVPSLETALLTPTAPVTGAGKTDTVSSFLAALQDDSLLWADIVAPFPVDGKSMALTRPVSRPLTPISAGKKTNIAQTRKGRPPAARKTSPIEPPTKKGKPNKSTSHRQKEKLNYLREKAEQLEKKLTSMKQRNREKLKRQQRENEESGCDGAKALTALITKEPDEFAGPMQPQVSLWERIAEQQREEKVKSEVENAKLREMMQGQVRLAKSLERLIRKRLIWDQLQGNSSTQNRRESMNEEKALEEMLRDVDARYPYVDTVLRHHGIGELDPAVDVDVIDDANMEHSPPHGMYLEHKEKKFMPFDCLLLNEVMWRSFGEGKLKHEDTQLTIIKNTENLVFCKATLPLSQNGENENVGVLINLSVLKRFRTGDRVVFVWFININAKRPQDEAISSLLLAQKGCAVMEPATLPDGSNGSVIRSYTTISSQTSGKDSEQEQAEHHEVGLLTEMVFAAYQQSRQSVNQTFENLLLDEMMTKTATSNNRYFSF